MPVIQQTSSAPSRICAAAIDNCTAPTNASSSIVVSRSSPGAVGASGMPIVVALISALQEFYVRSPPAQRPGPFGRSSAMRARLPRGRGPAPMLVRHLKSPGTHVR